VVPCRPQDHFDYGREVNQRQIRLYNCPLDPTLPATAGAPEVFPYAGSSYAANFLVFGVENLLFLWFPTRLVPSTPGDFQLMGRHILLMMAKMLVLMAALMLAAIPAGAASVRARASSDWKVGCWIASCMAAAPTALHSQTRDAAHVCALVTLDYTELGAVRRPSARAGLPRPAASRGRGSSARTLRLACRPLRPGAATPRSGGARRV